MTFEEFWELYNNEKITDLYDEAMEVFSETLSEDLYEEYDLGEIVVEFSGHHEEVRAFGKVQAFTRVLKANNPRLYDQEHVYFNDSLVKYYTFQRNAEALQEPVQDFLNYRLDYEMLLVNFKRLVFFDYLALADQIITQKYPAVKQDEELIPGAEFELGVVKYLMLLDNLLKSASQGEIAPSDWNQFQQEAAKYDFSFEKDEYLPTLQPALTGDTATYVAQVRENFPSKKTERQKVVSTLEVAFMQKMRQHHLSFPISGSIWDHLHAYWEEKSSSSWNSYFRITDKAFRAFLDNQFGFIHDYHFEVALILWGSSYVLDFLHDEGMLSQEAHDSQKNIVEHIRQDFIRLYHDDLWECDFVHDWLPAQGIASEDWQQEKTLFANSFEHPTGEIHFGNLSNPDATGPSLNSAYRPLAPPDDYLVEPASVNKIGRNEKVSVQYEDGTVKKDIKYKKVADDLSAGHCELL